MLGRRLQPAALPQGGPGFFHLSASDFTSIIQYKSGCYLVKILSKNTVLMGDNRTRPVWPGKKVTIPTYVDHYVLPCEKFPHGLQ
jgi:hypothetical protein